jgi:hypothetical protein
MDRFLVVMMLGGMTIAQSPVVGAQSGPITASRPGSTSETAAVDLPALAPLPRGKSTIVGGEIQRVDFVRDALMLKVFGKQTIKILFDERTQVYRDGEKMSLHELGPADHASVQTVLDGTSVYAISVHVLSHSPEGEYEGRVLSYNTGTRELVFSSAPSRDPFTLFVPVNVPVARVGQAVLSSSLPGTSDLVKGTLISVEFESDGKGRGVVSQMAILAAPGSEIVFSGSLSALDLHSGTLVVTDPRDNKSYRVFFDSAQLPTSLDLHPGDHVVVTTTYDGARYVANAITVD